MGWGFVRVRVRVKAPRRRHGRELQLTYTDCVGGIARQNREGGGGSIDPRYDVAAAYHPTKCRYGEPFRAYEDRFRKVYTKSPPVKSGRCSFPRILECDVGTS